MSSRRYQGNSGCAPLLLVVLLVFGFSWVSDTLDRFFTFKSGVSNLDYDEYKRRFYPRDGTELLRQQGFEAIDGKAVTWLVRVFDVDEDGVLTWCAEHDVLYDERGDKRWLSDCSDTGKVHLARESHTPRVNELIQLSFVPYDASDGNEIYIQGFDGMVRQ